MLEAAAAAARPSPPTEEEELVVLKDLDTGKEVRVEKVRAAAGRGRKRRTPGRVRRATPLNLPCPPSLRPSRRARQPSSHPLSIPLPPTPTLTTQRHTIRDLTTGQLFLIDGTELPTSDGEGGPTSSSGARVTDLASGKELTLADFDRVLGLHAGLEAVRRGRAASAAAEAADGGGGSGAGGAHPSPGSSPPPGSGAGAWVRRALAKARGMGGGGGGALARRRRATSTAGGEVGGEKPRRAAPPARPHPHPLPPTPPVGGGGGAGGFGRARPEAGGSGTTSASTTAGNEPGGATAGAGPPPPLAAPAPAAAAPPLPPRRPSPPPRRRSSLDSPVSSSSTLGGGGPGSGVGPAGPPPLTGAAALVPGSAVPVTVHRAAHRTLAGLTLIQALPAHDGPVWAAVFSPDGGFLATAGADAVVKVWEVVPGRRAVADMAAAEARVAAEARAAAEAAAAAAAAPASAPASPPSSSPASPQGSPEGDADGNGDGPAGTALPPPPPPTLLLNPTPARAWAGHKSDVLALAWSRSGFLLSASMDKAVRLWHATADPCLRLFRHTDFVTSLSFHPGDDRLFASGSIDGRARLWSIPDGRVAASADVRDMVTAAAFSPDGGALAVGTMKGRVHLRSVAGSLDAEGDGGGGGVASPGGGASSSGPRLALEPDAVLDVRNRRGGDAGGRKVTGIAFAPLALHPPAVAGSVRAGGGSTRPAAPLPPSSSSTRRRMLVSTNDSRIRLYDGCIQAAKFKGHANRHTQLRAGFDEGGARVVCGSDDGRVVVWAVPPRGGGAAAAPSLPTSSSAASLPPASTVIPPRAKVGAFEAFQAAGEVVTVALFGPPGAAATVPASAPEAAAHPAGGAAGALVKAVAAAGGAGGSGAALAARVGAARAWARSAAVGGGEEGGAAGAAALVAAGGAAAAAAALAAADAAMAASVAGPGVATLILAAGYGGELRVFEAAGPPEWV